MITKHLTKYAAATGTALIVAIGLYIQHIFSDLFGCWFVVATFFICVLTKELPLRQSFIYLLMMVLLVLSVGFLQMNTNIYIVTSVDAVFFVGIGLILLVYRPVNINQFHFLSAMLATLLIANLFPSATQKAMMTNVMSIVVGGMLGLIFSKLILRNDPYLQFRQGLLPVLQASSLLSQAFVNELSKQPNARDMMTQKKVELEKALIPTQTLYPEWVYVSGFNPGLRSGFRFFLVHLERVTELLFSLSYWLTQDMDDHLKEKMRSTLCEAISKNIELISILQQAFRDQVPDLSLADFVSDVELLDAQAKKVMPNNDELLDIAPDYVILVSIIKDIKDIRQLLLQLIAALPDNNTQEKSS